MAPESSAVVHETHHRPPLDGGLGWGIVVGLFVAPWSALWGFSSLVFGILKFSRVAQFSIDVWARGIVRVSGVEIRATWMGEHTPGERCVFLSNHQSALDIPILLAITRPTHPARFMAKESLFKIPFLGWGMRATGFVPIRRESARHAAETFQEILQSKGGLPYSYIIFPEGTRSEDGRLLPFKRGTLGLALRLGLPIVPVTIADACRANPKNSYRVRPGTVTLTFHPPIRLGAAEGDRAQRDALLDRVHRIIAESLPDDQKPLAAG